MLSGMSLEHVIEPRMRDIDGLPVRRVLPYALLRMVGPFIFFDHFGPAKLAPGHGMQVRPHPHINLATVTYLFEGEIIHRDSLGSEVAIQPGAINWMTAGRGIAHSERTRHELEQAGVELHGLQLWVALPTAHEEVEPDFHHHDAAALPETQLPGVRLKLLAGSAYGLTSPVHTWSPLFYADATLAAGATLALPGDDEHAERAAYLVDGAVTHDGQRHEAGRMLVFGAGPAELRAEEPARLVVLGGAPLDGPRHIWWNFVSSSRERLEQAKADWKEGRFPKVVHDERERIPLPED
jgi:redox-sensitive bicupin YhaK (pirin superfamily)